MGLSKGLISGGKRNTDQKRGDSEDKEEKRSEMMQRKMMMQRKRRGEGERARVFPSIDSLPTCLWLELELRARNSI